MQARWSLGYKIQQGHLGPGVLSLSYLADQKPGQVSSQGMARPCPMLLGGRREQREREGMKEQCFGTWKPLLRYVTCAGVNKPQLHRDSLNVDSAFQEVLTQCFPNLVALR